MTIKKEIEENILRKVLEDVRIRYFPEAPNLNWSIGEFAIKKAISLTFEEAEKENQKLRRPYKSQKKRDLELCEAYQKGLVDGRKEGEEKIRLNDLEIDPLDELIEWREDDIKIEIKKQLSAYKQRITEIIDRKISLIEELQCDERNISQLKHGDYAIAELKDLREELLSKIDNQSQQKNAPKNLEAMRGNKYSRSELTESDNSVNGSERQTADTEQDIEPKGNIKPSCSLNSRINNQSQQVEIEEVTKLSSSKVEIPISCSLNSEVNGSKPNPEPRNSGSKHTLAPKSKEVHSCIPTLWCNTEKETDVCERKE